MVAILTVNAPDGIDGNGFSFAALYAIDFVNGQLVSSSPSEVLYQFDDGLSVALRGLDLDLGFAPSQVVLYQDGDPVVTVESSEEMYFNAYDLVLNGHVADMMSSMMYTRDPWGDSHTQYGSQQGDSLNGHEGDDTLNGSGGDDVLWGGDNWWDDHLGMFVEGQDTLNGGAGNDTLVVPTTGDTATGGADADRFVIVGGLGIIMGTGTLVITDFSSAQGDQIDTSWLTAGLTCNFIGTAAFTGGGLAAEVRYELTYYGVWVSVDADGDAYDDEWFILNGVTSLQASDFIL